VLRIINEIMNLPYSIRCLVYLTMLFQTAEW